MNTDLFCEKLVDYISGISAQEISPETPLLGEGIIDSFNVLEIITFIEDLTSIRINPEEVTINNFSSVRTLSGWIAEKSSLKTN